MRNDDLIAHFEPVSSHFQPGEWRDATGAVQDIREQNGTLTIRTMVPAGLYRGDILLQPGVFDMRTLMMEVTRVPDGKKVPLGPMDLDHLRNVMAVPMILVRVNGRFRGGLWFAMPGPEQIASGALCAHFGFEHEGGPLELELSIPERDRHRLTWEMTESLTLRMDDRRTLEWKPRASRRPRFFVGGLDRVALARKLLSHPGFEAARGLLAPPVGEWSLYHERNEGVFDLACLIGFATEDAEILSKAKCALLTLCNASTWSGRPDPLLMGGDNDRGIGFKLSVAGVGWEFLQDGLSGDEQAVVRAKAEEYLEKIYDFTLLQRAYMGCPSTDPHSLGTWWGVGIACMAFYDELPIARKALPFFHALMVDSLGMFPESGKAPWATIFPVWTVRYFAAAIEFGGRIPEVDGSVFYDHLAGALRACFRSPNTQEMQRGLRTVEHRILTAFLHTFHPSPSAASLYSALLAEERRLAGDIRWGMFDLLYGPAEEAVPADFPDAPVFARDTGNIIATLGSRRINIQIQGGSQAGARNSFRLQPHNREFPLSLGDFTLSVDGAPIFLTIQGSYGIFSASRNALCFEDGCLLTEGQYLLGDIPPERNAFIRRFCLNERFLYADINFTQALARHLKITHAQRIYLLDRQTGVILIRDVWASSAPLRVGTHLNCSGSITEESPGCHRLTGGQANTIAGLKFGDLGMSDDERGEIFSQVVDTSAPWRVHIGEPTWIPAYIYGMNGEAGQSLTTARYPRLRRWRLELAERVQQGHIIFALSAERERVSLRGRQAHLPGDAVFHLDGKASGSGWECEAEAVAHDKIANQVMGLGVTRWAAGGKEVVFCVPVDIRWDAKEQAGVIHSPTLEPVDRASGFQVAAPTRRENHPQSLFTIECPFSVCSI